MSLPSSKLDDIEESIAKLLLEKSLILSKELADTQDMFQSVKSSYCKNQSSSHDHTAFNSKSYPLYSSKKLPRNNVTKLSIPCVLVAGLILFFGSTNHIAGFISNPIFDDDKNILTSGYVVQNLKGDTVGLFHSWNIPESRTLYVNIVNSNILDDDKIQIIKDVVLSEKSVKLSSNSNASLYFYGWKGAINQASLIPTKYTIPSSFTVTENDSTNGDISIILSTLESPDGYSGFTKSTVEDGHILKSVVTIYKANQLSSAELETITRHELGHALGVIHSSNQNDLMYPQISAEPPLISECDVSALQSLYDGHSQKAVCEV